MKDELKGKNYDRISCTQLKKIYHGNSNKRDKRT